MMMRRGQSVSSICHRQRNRKFHTGLEQPLQAERLEMQKGLGNAWLFCFLPAAHPHLGSGTWNPRQGEGAGSKCLCSSHSAKPPWDRTREPAPGLLHRTTTLPEGCPCPLELQMVVKAHPSLSVCPELRSPQRCPRDGWAKPA